jgi:hypothetical protein
MFFDIGWVRGLLHGMLCDLEKRLVFPQQTKESIDSRMLASPTSRPPPNTPLRRIFTCNQPLALVACEGCHSSLCFFSIKGYIPTYVLDNIPTRFQTSCKFFTWVMLQRNTHMASKWLLSKKFHMGYVKSN